MSRSKKKQAILKDKNRGFQKLGSKLLRKRTKMLIDKDEFDVLPNKKNEVVNQYKVTDWKWVGCDKKFSRK